jgi:CMP-N,N'-diacetyllegionaminic acid synthase
LINKDKVLALIPARGGSKGVPRKNVRLLGEKPLIAHTIQAAKDSMFIDKVLVSTDDEEIALVSRSYGADVPFIRESNLASDEAKSIDVARDCLLRAPGYQILVLLQPTSPFRTAAQIDEAIKHMVSLQANSCVSVVKTSKSISWMFTMRENFLEGIGEKAIVSRRQDAEAVFELNGAIYVSKIESLLRTGNFLAEPCCGYLMNDECSIDIDTEFDFLVANLLMTEQSKL